jgi:hypothetical protein
VLREVQAGAVRFDRDHRAALPTLSVGVGEAPAARASSLRAGAAVARQPPGARATVVAGLAGADDGDAAGHGELPHALEVKELDRIARVAQLGRVLAGAVDAQTTALDAALAQQGEHTRRDLGASRGSVSSDGSASG